MVETTREPVEVLAADPQRGLTAQQVKLRQERGWSNQVTQSHTLTEGQIVRKNCLTFFNFLFLVMAIFLLVSGSSIKNIAFMGVVLINLVSNCFQEIRAKRAVDKLTLVAAQTVTCIRDGRETKIRSDLLVRDDIVCFGPGDQICADAVLVSGQLQVNEALITGEDVPITKQAGDSLMSGSFVVTGRGNAQLTQVGDDTFAAKLAAEAKKNPQAGKSEMMRTLDKLIKIIAYILVPVGIILFTQQFITSGNDLRASAEGTVAALVGMIPQGLFLLTSLALAVSAMKLSQKKVLVQDMNCIESLARVDILCVDKTGTITEPVMEVENVLALADFDISPVLTALYGSQEPDNDTAKALSEKFSGPSSWKVKNYIPFTSATKWCGGSFEGQGSFLVGAPEFILGSRYSQLQQTVEKWSGSGYRVLLVARYDGQLTETPEPAAVTPLALVLLTNRIRPEAPKTFSFFAGQGVTVKVISGDNPVAASDVARRAGIHGAENYVDCTLLQTEADIFQAAAIYTVFGRVTPDQKKQLILALKRQGHTVAMTGDGVNDVLALKEADCGIAMAGGAQAASQIARMVLVDADFSAMPSIVDEGRRVINNIQRAAAVFLVKNIFSMIMALAVLITQWPFPVKPLHLTLVSALTIGMPSFLLALEPNFEQVKGKFLPQVLRNALPGGLTNIIVVLLTQWYMQNHGYTLDETQTICTAVLAMTGLLVLLQVCRPFSTFRKIIWGAMAVGLVGSFLLLGSVFELQLPGPQVKVLLAALLVITPAVFLAMHGILHLLDKLRHPKS